MVSSVYVKNCIAIFRQYKKTAEQAMAQVSDEALFIQQNEDNNSIATVVKHLHGNMLSRWTDFLITDGEKEWRTRDDEFENDLQTREKMMALWEEGWRTLDETLCSLKPEDIDRTVYIRAEPHAVVEAINRQIAHYAYHVGQIVLLCKQQTEKPWASLSIPRNGSAEFNAKKFGK